MRASIYQEASRETWKSVNRQTDELHALIGLSGEVGELHEKIKKLHRDELPKCATMDEVRAVYVCNQDAIKKELGDIAYYLARCCDMYGLDADDVLESNLCKIRDRKSRGVLEGSGDDR